MVVSAYEVVRGEPARRAQRRCPATRRELSLTTFLDRLAAHHAPTYDHCRRVASLCRQLAIKLGLNHEDVRTAFAAGLLHDVGHLFTSAEILNKQGPLCEAERSVIVEHPAAGFVLAKDLDLDPRVATAVFEHHERPDGRGYPRAMTTLSPITGIVAVASTFDSITYVRWENRVQSQAHALHEVRRVTGTQLFAAPAQALFALFGEPW